MESTKTSILKAIMNNPKLAKELQDGFAAPLGSTKRKKVQMIFKSMNNSTRNKFGNQDGQGGLFSWVSNPFSGNQTLPKSSMPTNKLAERAAAKPAPLPKNTGVIPNPVSSAPIGAAPTTSKIASNTKALPAKLPTSAASKYVATKPDSRFMGAADATAKFANEMVGVAGDAFNAVTNNPVVQGTVQKGYDVLTTPGGVKGYVAKESAKKLGSAIETAFKYVFSSTGTRNDQKIALIKSADAMADAIENKKEFTAGQALVTLHASFPDLTEAEINSELNSQIKELKEAKKNKDKKPEDKKQDPGTSSSPSNVINPATSKPVGAGVLDTLNNKTPTGTSTANTVQNQTLDVFGRPIVSNTQQQQQEQQQEQTQVSPSTGDLPGATSSPSSSSPTGNSVVGQGTANAVTQSSGLTGTTPSSNTKIGPLTKQQGQDLITDTALKPDVGEEQFATWAVADPNGRRAFLAATGMPESALPDINLVFANQNDIIAAYKKESNIDQVRRDLLARITDGKYVDSDIKATIAAKDEQVNAINALLDKTYEWSKGKDMADPYVAKEMEQYTNFLTTLKDRAQTRYTDFSKEAIAQFNKKTDQLTDTYNLMLQEYDDKLNAFKNDQTAAVSKYNELKKISADMYKTIRDKEMTADQKAIIHANAEEARAQTLNDTIGSTLGVHVPYAEKLFNDLNYREARSYTVGGRTVDYDVFTGNLWDAFETIGATKLTPTSKETVNPMAVLKAFTNEMDRNLKSPIDSQQYAWMVNNYEKVVDGLWADASEATADDSAQRDIMKNNVREMYNLIKTNVRSNLKQELSPNSGSDFTLPATVSALASLGQLKWGALTEAYLTNWVYANSDKVNPIILNAVKDFILRQGDAYPANSSAAAALLAEANGQYDRNNATQAGWVKKTIQSMSADDVTQFVNTLYDSKLNSIK